MKYFTLEFFEELARRLNADPDWSRRASALTTKITLTATDRALSYGVDVTGGAVTARAVSSDDPADFKFERPYEVWEKIATGALDFQTAVITGKMKFKGSLPKIMGIQPQMTRLTAVAKGIPAET